MDIGGTKEMVGRGFGRRIGSWAGTFAVVAVLLVGGLAAGTVRAASSLGPSVSPLTVSISVNPPSVVQGSPFTVSATVSGGAGPFTYDWNNFPGGCPSPGNVSSWPCTLSSSGNYGVGVTVTNHTGAQGVASQSFTVTSSGNGGGGGGNGNGGGSKGNSSNGFNLSGLGPVVLYALLAGIIGFALLVALTVGVIMIAVILARRLPRPPRGGVVCGSCHAVAPAGSKFCPACGAALAPISK